MSSPLIIGFESALVFGVVLPLAVVERVSLRRDRKRSTRVDSLGDG